MQLNHTQIEQEKICIVTVLYKSEKHIKMFLSGLENNLEVIGKLIIVDNHSNDDAKNIIKDWSEKNNINVEIITNNKNLGYAAAANIGIRLAEKNFKYILLTNNDLFLKEKALNTLLENIKQSDGDVMGIPGRSDDGEVFFGFNYKESYLKLIKFTQIRKKYFDFLIEKDIKYFPCDFPSGLILLFNKSFFEKIGHFDEQLFFSGDETDFAIRVNENKEVKSFVSLSSYELIDHVSFGTSGNSLIKNKNYIRGYIYLLLKHTDNIFSIRFWARLIYFLTTIIYSRPSYIFYIIFYTVESLIEFRHMGNIPHEK